MKQKVNGLILIDKPMGMTSQQVVSKVKWLFKSPRHNSKKAGHTGTLDPMATGLLPICLGEATKFSHYQLDADKSYRATLRLGEKTDTGDAEGQVVAKQPTPMLTQRQLDEVTKQFVGQIQQIPPMYSALKKDGKKLYEYARAGQTVEREARNIHIRNLHLISLSPDTVSIVVTCSKGTYVRTLGEDIAQALGTVGHLTSLRRTGVGDFHIEDAITLSELEQTDFEARFEHLQEVDACIEHLPKLELSTELCERLRLGQRLNVFEKMTQEHHQLWSDASASEVSNPLKHELHSARQVTHQTKRKNPLINQKDCAKDVRVYDMNKGFAGLATLSASGHLQPKKMMVYEAST